MLRPPSLALCDAGSTRRSHNGIGDPGETRPRIEITAADLRGSRELRLRHTVRRGRTLDALEARRTLRHVAFLWGYPVVLDEVDEDTGKTVATHREGRA